MKRLIRYFFQGLLLIAPVAITGFVIIAAIAWIDELIPIELPGVGFIIIISAVTIIGYFSSSIIFKSFFIAFERLLIKTPLIKIIYTALKDLFSIFVRDGKRFDAPVLVKMNKELNIERLGFLTQSDLSALQIKDKVAVYIPHSYNVSGNLYIVPVENVTYLKGVSSTEAMKFMISGGIASVEDIKEVNIREDE